MNSSSWLPLWCANTKHAVAGFAGNERVVMRYYQVAFFALMLSLESGITAPVSIAVFEDTFEAGNLNQWTGKPGFEHQGQIVNDPLNPLNHVLTFTGVNAAGDIFSASPIWV